MMEIDTTKPWYKKWWGIALAVFVGFVILGAITSEGDEPGVEASATTTTVEATATTTLVETTTTEAVTTTRPPTTTAPTTAPTTTVPTPSTVPEPQFTLSEENAIAKAGDYLDYTAFSRSGLIDQLEYEGFTTAEATLAVDYLDVDWNEQAWMKAEDYLDYTAFSRSGLIDQLEFEGFTTEQATYGVDKTGL
jgi:hypothetical protein